MPRVRWRVMRRRWRQWRAPAPRRRASGLLDPRREITVPDLHHPRAVRSRDDQHAVARPEQEPAIGRPSGEAVLDVVVGDRVIRGPVRMNLGESSSRVPCRIRRGWGSDRPGCGRRSTSPRATRPHHVVRRRGGDGGVVRADRYRRRGRRRPASQPSAERGFPGRSARQLSGSPERRAVVCLRYLVCTGARRQPKVSRSVQSAA
jgi:hypothetical protein